MNPLTRVKPYAAPAQFLLVSFQAPHHRRMPEMATDEPK
jgi:hypothetical protein